MLGLGNVANRSTLLVGAGTSIFVIALATSQGGYFPTSWGWGALLLLAPTIVAWALGRTQSLTAWRVATVAAVAAMATWTALSISWSTVPDQSVLETERAILYLAAALAAVTFVQRSTVPVFVGSVLVAIVAVATYALATRLFPARLGVFEPLGVYRLADPLGYWNALALFVAIGLLIALMFVARARNLWSRCAAAAAVPVLVATFYFTFGRAAWLSLGIALAAVLLTTVPTAALTILVCEHGRGLTHRGAALHVVVRDGHEAAWRIVVLAALAAGVELVRSLVVRHVAFPRGVRIAFGLLCLAVVLAAAGGAIAHEGGPVKLAKRAKDTFVSRPVSHSADLNRRLFSFSGNGRANLWHAAWQDARLHPWLGSGAGTYERYWLRNRPNAAKVRDAHSLYLETLAELGPVGLALVICLLGVPLAACVRARRSPLVPGLAAAIVVYAVHASVDWDWEVSVLGVVVIGLGVAAIAAGESPRLYPHAPSGPVRAGVASVATILAVAALAGLAGNRASAEADTALADGRLPAAAGDAVRAQRWMPWSPEPWSQLGNAQLAAGDIAAARASFNHELRLDRTNWSAWLDVARAAPRRARARDLRIATHLNPFSPEIADYKASLGGGS
jgi:O-antigen ligase